MIRVAAGEKLSFTQGDIERRGASIECRVYAEDPENHFLPSPGVITALDAPSGPGVRDDSSAYAGAVISRHYDPVISKLMVWAPDRPSALARLRRAVGEYRITGIRTNLAFHRRLASHAEFAAGRYDTGFIEEHESELVGGTLDAVDETTLAAALAVGAAVKETQPSEAARPDAATPSPWVAAHRAQVLRRR